MSQNFTDYQISTTLYSDVTSANSTVIYVVSAAGFPVAPFEILIDNELMLVTNSLQNSTQANFAWTVQRGFDSSTTATHSTGAVVVCTTSAGIWQEANDHLTQNLDQHGQYFRADGTRHDLVSNHTVGSSRYLAQFPQASSSSYVINTDNEVAPRASHWDDQGFLGTSLNPANASHVHGRETDEELRGNLWPAGTILLWSGDINNIPPYWLPCLGLDVRTDLAPEFFAQVGYSYGSSVDWYPPAPVFPSVLVQNGKGQYGLPTETAAVTDPRKVVMRLPAGSHTYCKTPNINHLPQVDPSVVWIIKVDYGYVYSPRPKPPGPSTVYAYPYAPGFVPQFTHVQTGEAYAGEVAVGQVGVGQVVSGEQVSGYTQPSTSSTYLGYGNYQVVANDQNFSYDALTAGAQLDNSLTNAPVGVFYPAGQRGGTTNSAYITPQVLVKTTPDANGNYPPGSIYGDAYSYSTTPAQPIYTPVYTEVYQTQYQAVYDPVYTSTEVITAAQAPSGFQWSFDADYGIPVITGSAFTDSQETVTGPISIPLLPEGYPVPSGKVLLPYTFGPASAYTVNFSTAPGTPAPSPDLVVQSTPDNVVTAGIANPSFFTSQFLAPEDQVQLKYVDVPIGYGYGNITSSDSWVLLAGAPFLNASDPQLDGYYLSGDVSAQDRNGSILIQVSGLAQVTVSPSGVVNSTIVQSGTARVFYPVAVF